MREEIEAERIRREAWQERRRTSRGGFDQAIDALYVQLFGDPRNLDDRGAIGENTARIRSLELAMDGHLDKLQRELGARIERLERRAAWIGAGVVTALLALIADLITRLASR